MSSVNVQLIKGVDMAKPKGTYEQMTVTHKVIDPGSKYDGKIDAKKLFDFNCPEGVWNTLRNAKEGDIYTIDREKDKKEGKYWEWVGIRTPDGSAAVPAAAPAATLPSAKAATPAPQRSGGWETPEERAARQVMIVRQSNITAAIEFVHKFRDDLPEVTVEDVLQVARQFENHVFGRGTADLQGDIPE